MEDVVKYTVDSSFAAKGIVPPRRKKKDSLLEEQRRLHAIARGYLHKIRDGDAEMYIPAIALVEMGAVVSRVTNNENDARNAVAFLRSYATGIFYDHEILEEAISLGIKPKAGGYNTVFLIVAEATGSELLTDSRLQDRLQHINALKRGLKSHLLREMVEAPS